LQSQWIINLFGGEGAEVIYALRNNSTFAQNILDNIGDTGQKTRKIYQRRLPTDSSKDYYFIHRNTGSTEPVIVEYGFIDDENNIDFLNNNYTYLAEAVIKAIADYKGYEYVLPEQTLTYTVKKGDTLYGIANTYNTTVDELKKLNNLTSNTLSIGSQLLIPTTNKTTDSYVVKSGDTLYSIANSYNTTADELKKLNNLVNNNLSIGQVLLLPGNVTDANTTTYTVKAGDTLYSIARIYNTTVDAIRDLNTLTTNLLSVGQQLQIPTSETVYTVKKGDTLYSIANSYNTTVDNIKKSNNLSSNVLSIGQQLIIK
jgi:LysM repeat protein